jgi:DNA-binding MarR family transcriptional regulator
MERSGAMSGGVSDLLSKVLVGLTIEMDNLHEARMAETWARPFKTSFVMWSNFLRYVQPGGTRVDDITSQSCVSRTVTASTVGAMERWGYVKVDEDPAEGYVSPRKSFGTASGIKPETVIYRTQAGGLAADRWLPLAGDVEQRWRERFDDRRVDDLRTALASVQPASAAPRFLPVVSARGLFAAASVGGGAAAVDDELPALLARALLALTLRQEEGANVSCAIGQNVLRVLGDEGAAVSALPSLSCVSKEAVAFSLTWLEREGLAEITADPERRGKRVAITPAGREVQSAAQQRRAEADSMWEDDVVLRLRTSLEAVLDDPSFGSGLAPPPTGWRATGRYRPLTEAFVADPREGLPNHPMVLHRGGWPDGS